jgi:DinB superfamily
MHDLMFKTTFQIVENVADFIHYSSFIIIMHIPYPIEGEYNPYYFTYISKCPNDGKLLDYLKDEATDLVKTFAGLTEAQLLFRYAEGKWTAKESLLHLIDAERVFAYRALAIARRDKTPLPSFEQDDYVPTSHANTQSITQLLRQYKATRAATIALLKSFNKTDWKQIGIASGSLCSTSAIGYIILGHQRHHMMIFKDKYLIGGGNL